jgi:hypothetical protein
MEITVGVPQRNTSITTIKSSGPSTGNINEVIKA